MVAAGAIWAAILVTALLGAPNGFDAVTYHLTRVEHWIQNASVRHYPTHITRQIQLSPMAEFALQDHSSATNPRPITLEVCRQMYEDSL